MKFEKTCLFFLFKKYNYINIILKKYNYFFIYYIYLYFKINI